MAAAGGQAKPRRRIVPQLVQSPSAERPVAEVNEADAAAAAAALQPALQANQEEQSAWAREHLGPDRKVFVDLTDVANKEIDWRKILKERGVQKPAKQTAKEDVANGAGEDPLLRLGGRGSRQENPLARLIAKLEATYCVGAESEEEDEDEQGAQDGESSGSDSETEEEGAAGGSGEGDGAGSGEGAPGKAGKRAGGKKETGGDYDYFDDWIDDSEFVELVEHDKRKPKHAGFFISQGEIERTEEMLPGFEELKGKKGSGKRKAAEEDGSAPSGAAGAAAAATEGPGAAAAAGKQGGEKKKRKQGEAAAAAGDGEKPAKKKRVVPEAVGGAAAAAAPAAVAPPAKLSIAQLAALQGKAAAGGQPPAVAVAGAAGSAAAPQATSPSQQRSGSQAAPASAKKKVPYQPPANVLAAIAEIKAVADKEEAPPPQPAATQGEGEGGGAGEEGAKKPRRSLPRSIKEALQAFQPLFQKQEDIHGKPAGARILRELSFLEPFIARNNLAGLLRKDNKEKKAKEGAAVKPVDKEQLKQLIASKVKPVTVGSDDDFEVVAPRSGASPPGQEAQAGAAPAAAAQPAAWKSIDKGVQEMVYQYLKWKLGSNPLASGPGRLVQAEVINMFPPNTIDYPGLVAMYKAKERRLAVQANKAAAAAAAATAAQAAAPANGVAPGAPAAMAAPAGAAAMAAAAGAAAAAAASGPPQQPAQAPSSQQQQLQAPAGAQAQAGTGLNAAEVFAALAVAQAHQRMALTPDKQQQQQAAVPAGPTPPAASQPQPAAVPAEATAPAAAPAVSQQVAAQAAVEVQAAPAAASASLGVGGPPAAVAAAAGAQPAVPKCSDEECIAKAVSYGADEAEMRRVLEASRSSKFTQTYVRALMLAGPEGDSTAGVARRAVELGWQDWDATHANTKNSLARATQKDYIVFVGKSKFALKAMPGVQEVPRPHRTNKQSGASTAAAAPADDGSVGTTAAGVATGAADPAAEEAMDVSQA